jgi:hypothetical protein
MCERALQQGDELRCPHCRRWHPVTLRYDAGTPYSQAMMFWGCGGLEYYAGQLHTRSRHETRPPLPSSQENDPGT